jgi:hypothetical protein
MVTLIIVHATQRAVRNLFANAREIEDFYLAATIAFCFDRQAWMPNCPGFIHIFELY